jgi:hypothetical protein
MLGSLEDAGHFLSLSFFVSLIHLLFPVNQVFEMYFLKQTNRKQGGIGVNFFNELCLFVVMIVWLRDYIVMNDLQDSSNLTQSSGMSKNQVYASNMLWHQINQTYNWQYVLALAATNSWFKLLLRLRVTRQFGPMFKVVTNMVSDLARFMVLWSIVLIIFTSLSLLIFSQFDKFQDFFSVFYLYFESSLGTWDVSVYCGTDIFDNDLSHLCGFGKIYTFIFLLINSVLFLNFVIAILSSTFAYYEDKQLGLYYEVIVALFPSMEFDDRFGAVVCAQPPFNLFILPFQWITIFLKDYHTLVAYNNFLCHLLYFPLALTITLAFSVINCLYLPLAYVAHIGSLIETLTDSDETMDELSEKIQRVFTIFKFILLGPIVLLFSVPIDMLVFFGNLYTRPSNTSAKDRPKLT